MADIKIPRLNKVIISGRLTNDPELRYTAKGTPVIRFTLAVDRTVKDASGQFQNQASFLDVVAWAKWAESLSNTAHKGSPIIVEGHLETRSYTDSNNNNRKSVEIIAEYIQFLEYRPKGEEGAQPEEHETEPHLPEDDTAQPQVTNDDVPF
jgi:single-strand DNA-binding protein